LIFIQFIFKNDTINGDGATHLRKNGLICFSINGASPNGLKKKIL
jgi:hypothetical protein